MGLMKIDVLHIAKLANLPLSPEDTKKYKRQLLAILGYIDKLKNVKTDGITETSQVTGLENVTKSDKSAVSLPQEEALANSQQVKNGSFKVKAIF
jgi:aspartyl-tRNA(Asn)/glutamyl-tRNA(Gln) amidotransferase subunit C